MACRLFGDKPLSDPMIVYCQLDPYEQISVKIEWKIMTFSFKKMDLKMSLKCVTFCLSLNVVTQLYSSIGDVSLYKLTDTNILHRECQDDIK